MSDIVRMFTGLDLVFAHPWFLLGLLLIPTLAWLRGHAGGATAIEFSARRMGCWRRWSMCPAIGCWSIRRINEPSFRSRNRVRYLVRQFLGSVPSVCA